MLYCVRLASLFRVFNRYDLSCQGEEMGFCLRSRKFSSDSTAFIEAFEFMRPSSPHKIKYLLHI